MENVYVGMPVWRYKNVCSNSPYEALEVIGETTKSWIVGSSYLKGMPGRGVKVSKKERLSAHYVISAEKLAEIQWVDKNAWELLRESQSFSKSYGFLKELEALIAKYKEARK